MSEPLNDIAAAEEFQGVQNRAPAGEYELWTGCSWRRFGIAGTSKTIIEPCYYSRDDKHLDLEIAPGVAELLIAARNTDLPARLLAKCEEVERLRAEVSSLQHQLKLFGAMPYE
jgi:hypothetical protein